MFLREEFIWIKVFKNGSCKIFKVCLPQILLGQFLNTLNPYVVNMRSSSIRTYLNYHLMNYKHMCGIKEGMVEQNFKFQVNWEICNFKILKYLYVCQVFFGNLLWNYCTYYTSKDKNLFLNFIVDLFSNLWFINFWTNCKFLHLLLLRHHTFNV